MAVAPKLTDADREDWGMGIETKFDVPFVAGLALREKQIQQNYRPIIAVHKWFARRPGTLFRALTLAEFGDGSLADAFYAANDFPGRKVADIFMGGGTPPDRGQPGGLRCDRLRHQSDGSMDRSGGDRSIWTWTAIGRKQPSCSASFVRQSATCM